MHIRVIACLTFICFLALGIGPSVSYAGNDLEAKRTVLTQYIVAHYPTQLTDPAKKKRRSMSQFGYNLSFFSVPMFPVYEFIEPNDYGLHSYGQPSKTEKNGALYSCKGGFLDFSHIRAGADWTVYLAFRIITDSSEFALPHEAGDLRLKFTDVDELSVDDIVTMAQKIAYERLVWHEIVSWHHHGPNFLISEQQSTFTPEDLYSNLLGTIVGKNVALRILTLREDLTYEQITSEEIAKAVSKLGKLTGQEGTMEAYDIIDRNYQLKLPAELRNEDIWWDSRIIFRDERYIFKRDMDIGPTVEPWLVPAAYQVGCPADGDSTVLLVPEKTSNGAWFYNYYQFEIIPDSVLFYHKRKGTQLHEPFSAFVTSDLQRIVDHVGKQMEAVLLPGYDVRNNVDPVPRYKGLIKVIFDDTF